jgi:hypothetical protein
MGATSPLGVEYGDTEEPELDFRMAIGVIKSISSYY